MTTRGGVQVRGLKGIENALKELGDPKAAERITNLATSAGARVIRDEARFHAPSPELAQEIVSRRKKHRSGSMAQVGYTRKAWYAHFVELGARAHTIAASIVTGKVRKGGGRKKRVLANQAQGKIFGRVVQHPGSPAQEILQKSAESEQRHVVEVMGRRMWKEIEKIAAKRRGTS